jgi:anti-sigma B factor antagonist
MAQASQLTITEQEAGDVTTLMLSGQITLDDGDLALGQAVHDLVERGRQKILLDLGGVSYIDSAGVGMMAGSLKTVRERGGDMKLVNLTTRGQRLFGMMKLQLVFEIFEDADMAVRSFAYSTR